MSGVDLAFDSPRGFQLMFAAVSFLSALPSIYRIMLVDTEKVKGSVQIMLFFSALFSLTSAFQCYCGYTNALNVFGVTAIIFYTVSTSDDWAHGVPWWFIQYGKQ